MIKHYPTFGTCGGEMTVTSNILEPVSVGTGNHYHKIYHCYKCGIDQDVYASHP